MIVHLLMGKLGAKHDLDAPVDECLRFNQRKLFVDESIT